MDDEDTIELIQRAAFGKQVDQFMSSDVGRYMIARAEEQKRIAQDEFKVVDCNNAEAVFALQNKIVVADNILQWLADAVRDGLQALELLDDRS